MTPKPALLLGLAPLALLAACSGKPEDVPADNLTTDEAPIVTNEAMAVPEAPPVNEMTAAVPSSTPSTMPEDSRATDTQMLDDADATGMTARVDRGATEPADTSEPAEQPAEKK